MARETIVCLLCNIKDMKLLELPHSIFCRYHIIKPSITRLSCAPAGTVMNVDNSPPLHPWPLQREVSEGRGLWQQLQ